MLRFLHRGTVYGARLLSQPGSQEGSEPPESWEDVGARLCLLGWETRGPRIWALAQPLPSSTPPNPNLSTPALASAPLDPQEQMWDLTGNISRL